MTIDSTMQTKHPQVVQDLYVVLDKLIELNSQRKGATAQEVDDMVTQIIVALDAEIARTRRPEDLVPAARKILEASE
jgi:hypothetical protein